MNILKKFGLAFAAAVALFLTTSSANAGFQVTFIANAVSTTIVDGGAGDDDLLVNNEILVISELVGAYTFNVTLAMTNSPGGGIAFVQTGTNNITGTGATTIEIIVSANDFTSPVGLVNAISGSTTQFLPLTVDGNTADASYTAYIDQVTNLLYSTTPGGTLVGSAGPTTIVAPGGNADLEDVDLVTISTTPYSLTLALKTVLDDPGVNRIDMDGVLEINPTPVPAGLVMVVCAVPALALGFLRRRKIQPQNV